jgi:DDE superfamily endonuclease
LTPASRLGTSPPLPPREAVTERNAAAVAELCRKQVFLALVARRYHGRSVALLLDEDPSHTARASQALAAELGLRLLWLPKRCPELNGMDHLWGHGKDHICANRQYDDLDAEVERFIAYLESLSNQEARRQAGLLSKAFWLRL